MFLPPVIRLVVLLCLIVTSTGLMWWLYLIPASSPFLEVTFLDVGQGDAILIETPDGVDVLVDGGPDGAVVQELPAALGAFDRTLSMVVGTHPDKDHIGGLVSVLARYDVDMILTTENTGETDTAKAYQTALQTETEDVVYARAGQVYALGASTTLAVYAPARDPSMLESNTASIVVKISYGEIDFMLTGDAPQSIEDYISVTYGEALESEVLKLGHHGSKTSTSDLFLQTVAPMYAVVSAGRDNSYGHPHTEIVERVAVAGVTLLSTATAGSITFVTDGKTVVVKE
jgi:competence protein ComEC